MRKHNVMLTPLIPVLFEREMSGFKAANDCDYQAFLKRSAA
jgi:hypothetical protein